MAARPPFLIIINRGPPNFIKRGEIANTLRFSSEQLKEWTLNSTIIIINSINFDQDLMIYIRGTDPPPPQPGYRPVAPSASHNMCVDCVCLWIKPMYVHAPS